MLKLCGVLLLLSGSTGLGWSIKEALQSRLKELYRLREILCTLQNEIVYSRTTMPEACCRMGESLPNPYQEAFLGIHQSMVQNSGEAFAEIWKRQMNPCLSQIDISRGDKELLLEFGNCIGQIDNKLQAELVTGYMNRLELSIDRLEKEMSNRCRVIMSLSIMGGLMMTIILL